MAELEKAILGLECCLETIDDESCPEICPYYSECMKYEKRCIFQYVMRDALTLLKAQEPIEPEADVDTWVCSKCGHRLEHQEMLGTNILFDEWYSYCPGCGRAVKWDETD